MSKNKKNVPYDDTEGLNDMEKILKAHGFVGGNVYHPNGLINQGCPNCGYCPHCGRGGFVKPYVWNANTGNFYGGDGNGVHNHF